MRAAFEAYFGKLTRRYQMDFGTAPTVCYTDNLNKKLLISGPDADGEVEWSPAPFERPVDWNTIEKELGFILSDELKAYYSTYQFLRLSGKFGSALLTFEPIIKEEEVPGLIRRQYANGVHTFPDSQYFLLGDASMNEDDGYFIYFDNESGRLICYDPETRRSYLLAYSIAKIIGTMEACI